MEASKDEPLTVEQLLNGLSETADNAAAASYAMKGYAGEDEDQVVDIAALAELTGLGLQIFSMGTYIQGRYLNSDIPDEAREEMELAWMKYGEQLNNTLALIGPLLSGIQTKRKPIIEGGGPTPPGLRLVK